MSILEFFVNITDKDYVLNVFKDYQKAHNNVPFKDFFYASICRKCEPYICEQCGAYSQDIEGFLCPECREVDDGDNQERA